MKKKTKEKAKAIAKYSGMWVATIIMGFLSWVMFYGYRQPCELCEPKTNFIIGMLAGVTTTACYFMLFSICTPIVRWVWGKIKNKPQSFIRLIK